MHSFDIVHMIEDLIEQHSIDFATIESHRSFVVSTTEVSEWYPLLLRWLLLPANRLSFILSQYCYCAEDSSSVCFQPVSP